MKRISRTVVESVRRGVASGDDLERLGKIEVAAIKSDPDAVQYRNTARPIRRVKGRDFDFTLSDESADRMGDVIRAPGWHLAAFNKNPIMLWGHKDDVPLGNWGNVRVESESATLAGTTEFMPEGISEFADMVQRMVDARVVRATSVGFRPLKTAIPSSDKERSEWGLGEHGVLYENAELLETSIVTVPANANALRRSVAAFRKSVPEVRDETVDRFLALVAHSERFIIDMGKREEEKRITRGVAFAAFLNELVLAASEAAGVAPEDVVTAIETQSGESIATLLTGESHDASDELLAVMAEVLGVEASDISGAMSASEEVVATDEPVDPIEEAEGDEALEDEDEDEDDEDVVEEAEGDEVSDDEDEEDEEDVVEEAEGDEVSEDEEEDEDEEGAVEEAEGDEDDEDEDDDGEMIEEAEGDEDDESQPDDDEGLDDPESEDEFDEEADADVDGRAEGQDIGELREAILSLESKLDGMTAILENVSALLQERAIDDDDEDESDDSESDVEESRSAARSDGGEDLYAILIDSVTEKRAAVDKAKALVGPRRKKAKR